MFSFVFISVVLCNDILDYDHNLRQVHIFMVILQNKKHFLLYFLKSEMIVLLSQTLNEIAITHQVAYHSSSVSCSVVSNSLRPHGLQPTWLLCPWNSPGENTGVGCHFLLWAIFRTQGSNLGLLHFRQILYHLSHQGSPWRAILMGKKKYVLKWTHCRRARSEHSFPFTPQDILVSL